MIPMQIHFLECKKKKTKDATHTQKSTLDLTFVVAIVYKSAICVLVWRAFSLTVPIPNVYYT